MASLDTARRHRDILQLLARRQRVPVAELIRRLGASPATVRRDLSTLEEQRQIVRVHGGVMLPEAVMGDISHTKREKEAARQKRSLARLAAKEVPERARLFIDAGTTCLELARELLPREDLTIYTHSVALMAAAQVSKAKVIGLGGDLRTVSLALVGAITLEQLSRLRLDAVYLGCSSLETESGAFTTETSEAGIKREALRCARHRVLLADASKLKATAAVHFANWDEFDFWFTDRSLKPALAKSLPVKVHRAE